MQHKTSIITVSIGALFLMGGLVTQSNAVSMQPAMEDSDVMKIVDAAKKAMIEQRTEGCIAIADADGELLFFQRQQGSAPNCTTAAVAKVKAAAKFQQPTETYHQNLMNNQTTMLAIPEMAPLPGGMPLLSNGKFVGAVAISTRDGDIDLKIVKAASEAFQ